MLNYKNNQLLLLSIILVTALIFSCSHQRASAPQAAPVGNSFHLRIRTTVNAADLQYDSMYHSGTSRAFIITDFRYYLSNITVIRDNDVEQKASCFAILVDPHRKDYEIGKLPEGSYKALRFTVGLDSAINHGDPTVFPAGEPLAIQTPGMHWDWNSGYLFMKLEGRVDTTKNSDGAPVTEFFYHIGMDTMKRVITIQTRFSIGKSSVNRIPVQFDLARMLAGIDMQSEIVTHTFDNKSLAIRLADRWQQAFSLDK